ncbi:MAG: four helix bundle protein [Planctomycetaceae bacterium]
MADGPSRSFRELTVWQKAHALVLNVYKASAALPNEERYGLTSQMRRAAVSVPANIAEGYRKLGRADKIRYLNIAQGSLEEVRYYLILTNDFGYLTTDALAEQLDEVARLLAGYIFSLRRPPDS